MGKCTQFGGNPSAETRRGTAFASHVDDDRGTGTFDFDTYDPSKPDFFASREQPSTQQTKLDANGNGTQTVVGGYDARGTDGSRALVHTIAHFTVVNFDVFTPTFDNSSLHCFP